MRTRQIQQLPQPVLPKKSQSSAAVAERKRMFLAAVATCGRPSIAAYRTGIRPSNVTYWKQTDEEFREQLEDAIEHFKAMLADQALSNIIRLADGAEYSNDKGETVRAAPHFQANHVLLKYADPEGFGNRIEHHHRAPVFVTAIPRARRLEELELDPDYVALTETTTASEVE